MDLPEQLVRFARDRGLGEELVKFLDVVQSDGAGVLLVGSVAENRYTPASDLDLLVLLRDALPKANLLHDEVPHPTALGSESLGFLSDVEVNVEYVEHAHAASLAATMRSYAASLGDDVDALVLPVPDVRDLRLLNRLRSGVVLGGAAVVDEWRRQIAVDLLPGFVGVLYFVTALDYLEDALGWRDRHAMSGTVMAREAAAATTMAYLAFHGRTHHDPKWSAYELDDLAGPADLADALRDIWFPHPSYLHDGPYIAAVQDACRLVLGHIESLAGLEAHLRFMRRYCAGRYRYGVADFVMV